MAIVPTHRNAEKIYVITEEGDVRSIADRNTRTEDHYLCRVACQGTLPAYSQAAVLVSCRGEGLMIIETHLNIHEL